MFGLMRVAPQPQALVPITTATVDVLEQHSKLSQELGIRNTVTRVRARAAFEHHLKTLGVRIYDQRQVFKYLTAQYGWPRKGSATWGWRPLRDKDFNRYATSNRYQTNGLLLEGAETYNKAVPLPVLLTVKSIAGEFPNAKFFVSDEYNAPPVPDPFLMVVHEDQRYIIERWDEPNYTEK